MKLFGSLKELVAVVWRKNSQEITLRPNQSTTYTAARDIQTPPQDANSVLVSENATQTLTGKTIDGDDNTLQDISVSSLKTVLGDANEVILRDGSGVVTSAQIVNVNIATGAAIDAAKIADGSVSSTEFQFINTLTSNAQTQLSSKVDGPAVASSLDNAIVRWDGPSGRLVQDSVVTVNDTGLITGVTQLNVDSLRLDDHTLSSTDTNGNIIIDPDGTGRTLVVGPLKSDTSLALEETGAGTDEITIQAPASIAAPYTLTLPVDDGTSGQSLTTDGSGVLSWSSPLTNPMTTTGDIIYSSDNSGTATRLAIGTAQQVLRGGTIPNYGKLYANYTNVAASPSGTRTIGTGDESVQVLTPSADINLKLDNTFLLGQKVTVLNRSSSFLITIVANDNSVIRTVYPNASGEVICVTTTPADSTGWEGIGLVVSNWVQYTPTFVNFTVSSSFMLWRRVGANLESEGIFTVNTVTASAGNWNLPNGYTFSSALVPTGAYSIYGRADNPGSSGFQQIIANRAATTTNVLFTSDANGQTPQPANTMAGGTLGTFYFSVPVEGWFATKG